MKRRLILAAIALTFLFSGDALARQADPGVTECIKQAKSTFDLETKICYDNGKTAMIEKCIAAGSGAILACYSLPTPLTCLAANAAAFAVCAVSFWAEWNKAANCVEAADHRYHNQVAICKTLSPDPANEPSDVQACRDAVTAESSHPVVF